MSGEHAESVLEQHRPRSPVPTPDMSRSSYSAAAAAFSELPSPGSRLPEKAYAKLSLDKNGVSEHVGYLAAIGRILAHRSPSASCLYV